MSAASASGKGGLKTQSIFRPVYLDQRVVLTPMELREAAKDVDSFLTKKLRKRLEEQCCIHGWVRGGSTQILARSMGQAEHCRFTGDFLYTCKVRVLCYLPESGQVVDAQILKVNKSGAYALIVDNGRVTEAVRVFLPRDLHLGNQSFDELQVEQVVRVKLLLSRFQANDAFIQAVATFEGMSMTEVVTPARKGALQPAVAPTEKVGASTEEAAPETNDLIVEQTEGGFSITRKGSKPAGGAPATPAPVPSATSVHALAAPAPAAPVIATPAPAPSATSVPALAASAPPPAAAPAPFNFAAIMAAAQAKAVAGGAKPPSRSEESTESTTEGTTDSSYESSESAASTKTNGSVGVGGLFGNEE